MKEQTDRQPALLKNALPSTAPSEDHRPLTETVPPGAEPVYRGWGCSSPKRRTEIPKDPQALQGNS
jgi:hypothetical protein